jgi:hypothetical protein
LKTLQYTYTGDVSEISFFFQSSFFLNRYLEEHITFY